MHITVQRSICVQQEQSWKFLQNQQLSKHPSANEDNDLELKKKSKNPVRGYCVDLVQAGLNLIELYYQIM